MMLVLLILPCHKARAFFIMWPFKVGMYAKHPLYTHADSETVCVCVCVCVCVFSVVS